MKEEDVEKCDRWFNKYGPWAAFIGRNFPIIEHLYHFLWELVKYHFLSLLFIPH